MELVQVKHDEVQLASACEVEIGLKLLERRAVGYLVDVAAVHHHRPALPHEGDSVIPLERAEPDTDGVLPEH